MPAIDRPGLYQADVKDHAVTVTRKKELPQLVLTLQATAIYNEATEEWDDWDFEQVITGYFVLMTLNDQGIPVKCLNYQQVMEAVSWDGETFSGLNAMDLKGTTVQIRVAEDTYEGNTTLKVNWIADKDAEIGLKKLSQKDLTGLDTKFGVKKNKAATPSSAKKKTAPKAPPKIAPKPPVAGKAPESRDETPCIVDEAFAACLEANEKLGDEQKVPENILNDYWLARAAEFAADPENITDEEAPKVRNGVLDDINIPF